MRIVINGKALWVNYHHLYCFYVVVTEGGLTKASKVLSIGQSALSIQMKQFEESLGFSLFDRAHRVIRPNEQGLVVFSYAREIFRLGGEMLQTLHDRPTAKRLHLQVGVLDTIPKHLSIELVEQALELRPCAVSVMEGEPTRLLQELADHRLDLVLTNRFPTSEPGKLNVKRIARVPLWLVGSPKFRHLSKGFPRSIQGQKVVLPTIDSHVRHEFEHYCKRQGIEVDVVVEAQDVMVQKLLALRGVGLTVVPEFAVHEYLEKRELNLIGKLQGSFEELFLVAASRKIENPAAAAVMKKFQIQKLAASP
jgi:LysR family transcriptional activator of nhaA